MCELLGVSSDHRIILNPYLQAFGLHSSRHPNGWGYASFEGSSSASGGNRKCVSLIKEPETAARSPLFRAMLQTEVCASCAMAHIRYATVGNVEYANCHPFSERTGNGRQITLIHNGTVFQAPELNRFLKSQNGETDSERILLYMVDRINRIEQERRRELTRKERLLFFDSVIRDLSAGNKLNLILFDGEYLYVHTNCRGTLSFLKKDGSVLVATQPLSDEEWKPFPLFRLCAFLDGALVYEGSPHGREYVPNDEDLKNLYLAYACL